MKILTIQTGHVRTNWTTPDWAFDFDASSPAAEDCDASEKIPKKNI